MRHLEHIIKGWLLMLILMGSQSAYAQIVGCHGKDAVLHNVNIVDVENGKILYNMDVVIENGIFKKIVSSGAQAENGSMIDLSGKYIMPGLIDSHTHWSNFADTDEDYQALAEAFYDYGITTVRDCGGNIDEIKAYNKKVLDGVIKGPYVYFSSLWAGENYCKLYTGDTCGKEPWNQKITDENRDFKSMIIRDKVSGCTGIKLYADIKKDDLENIVKLCRRYNIKSWGHMSLGPEYAYDAVKAGIEVLSHAYLLDFDYVKNNSMMYESPLPVIADGVTDYNQIREKIFDLMKENNQIFDPTIYLCCVNNLGNSVDYLRDAYNKGVKIAAGTDYIDIKYLSGRKKYRPFLLDELDMYVSKCGFSVPDAIKAATVVGAEVIDKKDKLGVIKEGAKADYLILDSNPLESLDAIRKCIENNIRKKDELMYKRYEKSVREKMDELNSVSNRYLEVDDTAVKDSLADISDLRYKEALDIIVEGIGMLSDCDLCLDFFSENVFVLEGNYNKFKEAVELIYDDFLDNPLKDIIMNQFSELQEKQLDGVAPEFSLIDINGNMVKLSDFRGGYVLIDFWASWCAPCRKGNRELSRLYDSLKSMNLNIISISLDKNIQQWKDAAAKDGIQWTMLNDPAGLQDSSVAQSYKVYNLPTVYLIDPQGNIVAKNPSVKELQNIITGNYAQ